MRIDSNKLAAWYFMGVLILGFLVLGLEGTFGLRDRLVNPPDLRLYTQPELRKLAREEWAGYEKLHGSDDRMSLRGIPEDKNYGQLLKDPANVVLLTTPLAPEALTKLADEGLKVQQEGIFAPSTLTGNGGRQLFLVYNNGHLRATIKSYVAFFKSQQGQEIANRRIIRKDRLS